MLGMILIQTVWHSDGIPERIFLKSLILKNNQPITWKIMKNNPVRTYVLYIILFMPFKSEYG